MEERKKRHPFTFSQCSSALAIPSYWIWFKVLVLTFKALYSLRPTYLRDHLSSYMPHRALCSTIQHCLVIPDPKDALPALIRGRAFSALKPTWWDELPVKIQVLQALLHFSKIELFHQDLGCGSHHLSGFGLPVPHAGHSWSAILTIYQTQGPSWLHLMCIMYR